MRPNPNLGLIADSLPVYTLKDHIKNIEAGGLKLVSAVHVEATVGQCPGGFPLDPHEETTAVMEQVRTTTTASTHPYNRLKLTRLIESHYITTRKDNKHSLAFSTHQTGSIRPSGPS